MPTFVHQGPASAVDDSGKDIQLKATPSGALVTGNIPTKFKETFETWPNDNWTQSQSPSGSNTDLIFLDGNALAASYLVISKDPFAQGTDTYVDTTSKFSMPAEVVAGLHLSQTAWGHDASIEFIEADYVADLPNIAIAGLSQIATAVTVDTVAPHNLVPGHRIGISDCSDSRFNYPSLVVSSIPTPTQFVCTGGPNGVLSGLTAIASVPGAKGSVFRRSALSLSKNGTALHFESPTNTLGFFYSRASAGDVFPFGSGTGNSIITRQATSVGSSGSTALTSAAYTYAWSPTTEYKLTCLADRLQWTDSAVDTTAAGSARLTRTQIIPDPFKEYFIRFKLNAQQSVTVPGANIQSIAKTASATATVTTFTPHGLVSNDLVVGFGVANATAFPALTTPAAVTVTSSTQFTVTWGSSTTATSYGGFIGRANGTCPLPGAVSQAIQSAVKTTLVDGSHQVVLVGSASWSGVAIGDHVNLYGVRDSSTNNLLGIDGVWKVANIATTTLTLVNVNSFSPVVADFNNPACAGGVIKRTEMRISYFRVFEFERQRFEMLARPSGDVAAAAPIVIQGGTLPSVTTVGTLTTCTTVTTVTAVSTLTLGNLGFPGIIADVASAALTSTTTTSAFTPTFGTSYSVNIPVTAVTGTNPTLDFSIEESDDGGTNWFKVYDFPRITATGMYRSPIIRMTGNRVRFVQTLGGTLPSFTRAVNRLQCSTNSESMRQLIDRALAVNTLNSATSALDVRNTGSRIQLIINMGTITTTAPAIQIEGSDDNGASYYAIGSPLTGVASSTVQLTVAGVNSALIRARVSTAGSGATLGYVILKANT